MGNGTIYTVEYSDFEDHSIVGHFTSRYDAETLRDLLNTGRDGDVEPLYEVVEHPLDDILPMMIRDQGWRVLTVSYNVDARNSTYSQPSVKETPRDLCIFCGRFFKPVPTDSVEYRNYLPVCMQGRFSDYDQLNFVVFAAYEDRAIEHCNTVMEELRASGLLREPHRVNELMRLARFNVPSHAPHEVEMAEQRHLIRNAGHCNRTLKVRVTVVDPAKVGIFEEGVEGEYTVRVSDGVLDGDAASNVLRVFMNEVHLEHYDAFYIDVYDPMEHYVLGVLSSNISGYEFTSVDWVGRTYDD